MSSHTSGKPVTGKSVLSRFIFMRMGLHSFMTSIIRQLQTSNYVKMHFSPQKSLPGTLLFSRKIKGFPRIRNISSTPAITFPTLHPSAVPKMADSYLNFLILRSHRRTVSPDAVVKNYRDHCKYCRIFTAVSLFPLLHPKNVRTSRNCTEKADTIHRLRLPRATHPISGCPLRLGIR